MNTSEGGSSGGNVVVRIWRFISRPSKSFALGTLLVVGFVFGILFWGGFHWAVELTNTETFCISCHEMRAGPYQDLKKTIHYTNRTGVRAICSDCHVPRPWAYKIIRKIQATNELFHKIMGTIDTPEKFQAHRLELAVDVWTSMKATNSRECRNCHENVWMDLSKQWGGAQGKHEVAIKNNLTCIDCHQGIAHTLPKVFDRPSPEQLTKDPNAWLQKYTKMVEEK